jgi:hypothetical protein
MRLVPRIFASLAIVLTFATIAFAGRNPHKIKASKPSSFALIEKRGGTLLADYGSYRLYEVQEITTDLLNDDLEIRDDFNQIQLNAATLNTGDKQSKAAVKAVGNFKGKRLHLVHFSGPIKTEWLDELNATGVKVITYIPENAYLVYAESNSLGRLQSWAAKAPYVQWNGAFADAYKMHPNVRAGDSDSFAIQLVDDADANAATLKIINQLKSGPIRRQENILGYVNVIVPLAAADVATIAAHPDVVSIQAYQPRKKFCERQDQIVAGNLSGSVPNGPGYLSWLASKGFTAAQFASSGFVVDVTDSGLDNGTTSPNHPNLHVSGIAGNPSRVSYARLAGTANTGSTLKGCDGHGTLNSHVISGYNDSTSGFPHVDSAGFHYGLGVCPFVKVGSSVIFDPNTFTDPSYPNLAAQAYRDGARISNNSWGAESAGVYDTDAQAYDALVRDSQPNGSTVPAAGNQQMVFCFAAGNAGPGVKTVGSPGTAKNVITVGAAENVQAIGGVDSCGDLDSEADNANDMATYSSRGPCADGRHKPEIVAPGTHISGGVAQADSPAVNGTADSCFNAEGVCGGVGTNEFFPVGQQWYTLSTGTSHSTPCVSGGCALLRQYFLNNFTNAPTPAMTKAYLMNSARYITGAGASDNLWSDTQGMGEMNLGTAFDGVARFMRDEQAADMFTASGQTRTFNVQIADSTKPFRVTIAWTDAPGSTTGNAYKNNLDLAVTANGQTYKGNVFSGQFSTPGGTADSANNAESVFLPAGVSGFAVITVTAANINSDGVPNNATSVDQDFALVAYNANQFVGNTAPAITSQPANTTAAVGDSATFSVGVIASPSPTYQWRRNGADISSATDSSYTRPAVQFADAGSFSVVISNSLGSATSSDAILSVVASSGFGAIAQWNFNSVANTNSPAPSLGTGTLTSIGGPTFSIVGGTGSTDTNATNNALNTANYPGISTGNKTAGIQVAVSTVGKQNIAVSWDERVSNTGSKYVRLQYTTNGTIFSDYPTANSVAAAATFETKSNSFAGFPGVDNNPNFAIRIVTEFESTAIGSANAKYIPAASGSTYGTGGTIRYDMLTIWGAGLPANPSLGFSSATFGTNGFQFSLLGTNAGQGVVEYSTNLSTWLPLGTNALPFTFTETNFDAPQKFYRARVSQ